MNNFFGDVRISTMQVLVLGSIKLKAQWGSKLNLKRSQPLQWLSPGKQGINKIRYSYPKPCIPWTLLTHMQAETNSSNFAQSNVIYQCIYF